MEPYWVKIAKKRMRELGITQSDLLDVFNVTTRGAVGHYFSGRSAIDVDQLESLSQKLKMRIDYYENTSKSLAVDDVERMLDSWLPRFAQADLVEYKTDIATLKKLMLSSLSGQNDSEKSGDVVNG
jgi:transcriptional regulator with XRE-family HTH domain